MANPEHVAIVKQGAEAIRQWRAAQPPNTTLDLAGAELRNAPLYTANLLGANLEGADLRQAELTLANLNNAHLRGANLRGANLKGVRLTRARLSRVKGAHQARWLETARFEPDTIGSSDARGFESCVRPWPERWLDWERLRGVGRLPLFGMSYTALIFIPIVFYGLAVYNQQIEQVHTWAEQIVAPPDSPLHQLASLLKRLDRRPIPSLSLVLLVSTFLLAAASTVYTWRCPSRIKEFSRDQWCDQLSRSLVHYWPFAWKERYVRLACAACYVLGGLGAAVVLGTKVWHTALFIWKHSTSPWPWW